MSYPLEQQVRKLRDTVYDQEISDEEWHKCKNNWIRDVEFLERSKPLKCDYPAIRRNSFAV